jgi:cytochrome c oxidase subunit 2
MIGLLIVGIVVLIGIIAVQIGKVTELAAKIRGEADVERRANERTARWLLIFMVVFLIYCVVSAIYYKNSMLGYGPHEAASAHGVRVDALFDVTLFFTGIVFVITHIVLFWFSYKYRMQEGRVGRFFAHNNNLELIWTIVPAVVMVGLVTGGLVVWNDVMPDVGPDEEVIEVEATGYQFAWDLRYPGKDGMLGNKNFQLIDLASNPLGQDWSDERNIDDFHSTELVLPVNKKIRVRITAKDVLHNFYLPHFRVKMDAVPGLPTYFIFTPTKTTEEYREELSAYPEWQVPVDPNDPSGPQKWEEFNYELACAELCGRGHYSMRRGVRIVTESEYNAWLNSQKSFYVQNIRNTENDPLIGQLLQYEIDERAEDLQQDFELALIQDDPSETAITLKNVFYASGSAELEDDSKYELDNLISLLKDYMDVSVEISGHTDNTGNADANQILSSARANSVRDYLVANGIDASRINSVGYGGNSPVDSNDTDEGRKKNRRVEMRITSLSI